jgi:hypothetical protein
MAKLEASDLRRGVAIDLRKPALPQTKDFNPLASFAGERLTPQIPEPKRKLVIKREEVKAIDSDEEFE